MREILGGARRADAFLLVIATILAGGAAFDFRSWHPPVIPLFFTSVWLQILARWTRHVRPKYAGGLEYLGAVPLGAALYAGWAGR